MKKLFYIILPVVAAIAVSSCNDDDNTDTLSQYEAYRDENVAYYESQAELKNPDGTPYYERLVPVWNSGAEILIHYFNDRALTAGNLQPLFTSGCAVKYIGRLYNDYAFDSSYLRTSALYGDSVSIFQPSGVIQGWAIALMDMRVGDSCEIVIPYQQGYGPQVQPAIPPYSTLKFNMKLVDIPFYEIKQ